MNTWSPASSLYSGAERRTDVTIQAAAVLLSIVALGWLIFTSWRTQLSAGLMVYAGSLLGTFVSSLVYGHLSVGRTKEFWRRIDHAMIFTLIAGTYTPLAAYRLPEPWRTAVLVAMWSTTLIGIVAKFLYPRRFEYIGLALCIIMGLTGILFIRTLFHTLMPRTLSLLLAGGVLYLLGVVVLQFHRLRFHNAIWHGCVLVAAAIHFSAISMEFLSK